MKIQLGETDHKRRAIKQKWLDHRYLTAEPAKNEVFYYAF